MCNLKADSVSFGTGYNWLRLTPSQASVPLVCRRQSGRRGREDFHKSGAISLGYAIIYLAVLTWSSCRFTARYTTLINNASSYKLETNSELIELHCSVDQCRRRTFYFMESTTAQEGSELWYLQTSWCQSWSFSQSSYLGSIRSRCSYRAFYPDDRQGERWATAKTRR